jgi:TetR/AcrR family transcriptional regulator
MAATAHADNRSGILGAALQLFAARGYDAVGIQQIVDVAGVTKPTLYHYFGSKRGLLDALIDERSAALRDSLARAAEYDGDLVQTLEAVVRAYFEFAQKEAAFYRMQLGFWFAPPQSDEHAAVLTRNLGQHAALERLFEAAAADHGNMRGRQRAYAATFLGMINTYIGLWLNGYAGLDDTLVYQAVHQFQHGIYS